MPASAPPSALVNLPSLDAEGIKACLKRKARVLPDRELSVEDIYLALSERIDLDKLKSACGLQALHWAESVRNRYGRRAK